MRETALEVFVRLAEADVGGILERDGPLPARARAEDLLMDLRWKQVIVGFGGLKFEDGRLSVQIQVLHQRNTDLMIPSSQLKPDLVEVIQVMHS